MRNKNKYQQRGSLLILTLWALSLLTVFAVYLGFNVQQKLVFLDRLQTRNKLYAIAEAGIKKAIADLSKTDPSTTVSALKDSWSENKGAYFEIPFFDGNFTISYNYTKKEFSGLPEDADIIMTRYGTQDETGKINMNTAEQIVLQRLIEKVVNVDKDKAAMLACCIIDWRDEDNQALANGAEDGYYRSLRWPYEAKDSAFQSLEELCYVKGFTNDIFEQLRPYLTIYSPGRININTASQAALYALGLSEDLSRKIVDFRCGEDKKEATVDDRLFTSASEAVAQLSQVYDLSPSEVAEFSNLVSQDYFSTASNIFFIQSTATLNNKKGRCLISCIFEKNLTSQTDRPGTILNWRLIYFM